VALLGYEKRCREPVAIHTAFKTLARSVLESAFADLHATTNRKPNKNARYEADIFFLRRLELGFWCKAAGFDYETVKQKSDEIIAERDR